MVQMARDTILKTIEARLNISLGAHIVNEVINTPLTWKSTFNLDRGAILGLSHSFFNVLAFRPKTKHASIKDLYFVGASAHPGTGVPIVLAGAKLVSDEILAKLRMEPKRMDQGEAAVMKEEYRVMQKWGVPLKSHLDVQSKTVYSIWLQWWVPVLLMLIFAWLWSETNTGLSVVS